MSKFCTTCGASLEDNATFCTNCGTPQDANNQQNNAAPNGQTPAASAADAVKNTFSGVSFSSVKDSLTMDNIKNITKKPNKNTIIGLAVIGVVVIAVIVLLCVLLLGGGYKKPLDNMIKAYETGEGKYIKEYYTKEMIEDVEDTVDKSKKYDDVDDYLDSKAESLKEAMEKRFGDDFKIKYSIKKKKALSKKQLKDIKESYEETYEVDKASVSDGYKLTLSITWKGEDDEAEDESRDFYVVKVNGTWTIQSGNFNPPAKKSGKKTSVDMDDLQDLIDDYT